MALKKLNSAKTTETKSKSKMKVVEVTNKNEKDLVLAVFNGKTQVAELEDQIKTIKGVLEPKVDELRDMAIEHMASTKDFSNFQFCTGETGIGIVMQDKYTTIKSETAEAVQSSIAEIVGEENVGEFLEYKFEVDSKALEDEKVWAEFEKFSDMISKKFGKQVIAQKMQVKKGAVDKIEKFAGDKAAELIKIIKPQINTTLKD